MGEGKREEGGDHLRLAAAAGKGKSALAQNLRGGVNKKTEQNFLVTTESY